MKTSLLRSQRRHSYVNDNIFSVLAVIIDGGYGQYGLRFKQASEVNDVSGTINLTTTTTLTVTSTTTTASTATTTGQY